MACLFLPFSCFKSQRTPSSRPKNSAEVAPSPRISPNVLRDQYKAIGSHDAECLDNNHPEQDPPSIPQHAILLETEESIDQMNSTSEKKNLHHDQLDPTSSVLFPKNINTVRNSEELDLSKVSKSHAWKDMDPSISSYSRQGSIRENNCNHGFYDEALPDGGGEHASLEKTNSLTVAQGRDQGSRPPAMPSANGSISGVKRVVATTSGHTSTARERIDWGIRAWRKKPRFHGSKGRQSLSPAPPADQNVMGMEQSTEFVCCAAEHGVYEDASMTSGLESQPMSDGVLVAHAHAKWNGNGIPNHTNKYKEDQEVCWHDISFERMLDRALAEEGAKATR